MSEYTLSDAVGTFSTYSGTLGSLWGLYIAATFAAAGFGASRADFGTAPAAILTVAFLAFALAHLRAVLVNVQVLGIIRREVLKQLESAPEVVTDYPETVRASLRIPVGPRASLAVHLVIDACVVAVIWASVSI